MAELIRQYALLHANEVSGFKYGGEGTIWALIESRWWAQWRAFVKYDDQTSASTPPTSTLPTSTLPTSTTQTSTLSTSTLPTSTLPTSSLPTSTESTSTLRSAPPQVGSQGGSYFGYSSYIGGALSRGYSYATARERAPSRPGSINNAAILSGGRGEGGQCQLLRNVGGGRDFEYLPPRAWAMLQVLHIQCQTHKYD